MNQKWLYIPVEVKVRELQAKLLLAKFAALRGYNVVIGRKSELLDAVHRMPKGIFFGMWVPDNFSKLYKRLKNSGFATTGLDEEGLVTFSDEIYANFRLSKETLRNVDTFFAWGDYQASIVKKYTSENTKIVRSGNLRFDLLRPELRSTLSVESDALRKKYGKFILVVSSFAFSNHFSGAEAYMEAQKKSLIIKTQDDENFFRQYIALQDKNFECFLDAIPELARALPDHKIVIRPHPSENIKVWEACRSISPNIVIDNGGNIHGWIMACDCIVHHFCTTALEAYAADIPAVAYRPYKDMSIELELPYVGSLQVDTKENLISKVRDIVCGNHVEINAVRDNVRPMLRTYIQNLDGSLCVETMLDEMDLMEASKKNAPLCLLRFKARNFVVSILRAIKRLVPGKHISPYIDHKFSSFTSEEISGIIHAMPGGNNIKIKPLCSMCYLLERL